MVTAPKCSEQKPRLWKCPKKWMDLKGYGEENCANFIAHDSACDEKKVRKNEQATIVTIVEPQ